MWYHSFVQLRACRACVVSLRDTTAGVGSMYGITALDLDLCLALDLNLDLDLDLDLGLDLDLEVPGSGSGPVSGPELRPGSGP